MASFLLWQGKQSAGKLGPVKNQMRRKMTTSLDEMTKRSISKINLEFQQEKLLALLFACGTAFAERILDNGLSSMPLENVPQQNTR